MKKHFSLFCITALAFWLAVMPVCATRSIADIYDISSISDNSISSNDLSSRSLIDYSDYFDDIYLILSDIQTLQSYYSYDGVIPEPYYTYMKDILSWSTISDNYVAFVSSYTFNSRVYPYYVLALGDIKFSGSVFTGSDIDVYIFYPTVTTYSGSNYSHTIQSSFSFTPGSNLCFTDLDSSYPDLRGTVSRYLFIIIVVLALVIVFYVCTRFGIGNYTFRRHGKNFRRRAP